MALDAKRHAAQAAALPGDGLTKYLFIISDNLKTKIAEKSRNDPPFENAKKRQRGGSFRLIYCDGKSSEFIATR